MTENSHEMQISDRERGERGKEERARDGITNETARLEGKCNI